MISEALGEVQNVMMMMMMMQHSLITLFVQWRSQPLSHQIFPSSNSFLRGFSRSKVVFVLVVVGRGGRQGVAAAKTPL